jgi:hypothetical protein
MSGSNPTSIPPDAIPPEIPSFSVYVPPTDPYLLYPGDFNALIGQIGQRVSWSRSHSCPCTFTAAYSGGSTAFPGTPFGGRLSTPGSPQRQCRTCLGLGIYWDAPSLPFQASMSFRHISPSPDEPGTVMDSRLGVTQMSEPSLTIPYFNPFLDPGDPRQPTLAWTNTSAYDMIFAVDMLTRYTSVLTVGGQQNLPLQQNLQIASSGAVTVWDPGTQAVVPVSGYIVSGATVTLPSSYASGTSYMVEFLAAASYVVFRRAGGFPHTRPMGGGTTLLPKAFSLQMLDFWTRQRGMQAVVNVGGVVLASQIT